MTTLGELCNVLPCLSKSLRVIVVMTLFKWSQLQQCIYTVANTKTLWTQITHNVNLVLYIHV